MIDRVGRAWRVVGTGLAFTAFGVGGLLLQVVSLSLMYLLFPHRARRQKAMRRLVHWLFWVFVRFMWLMGVLRFRFIQPELLQRPGLIIVANHPTLLDVVFLISAVPDATCIVRAGLASNPFTRAAVSAAGYVCNDWGVELVEASVQALRAGSSMIIFPEGTRSNALNPNKWHRGAANIALKAGVPLTPVRIGCDPPSLRKGEPWWRVPARPMQYSIEVLSDLSVTGAVAQNEFEPSAARGLTERLEMLLTQASGAS
jgi:1-acyl-sn-glycerol-3-phosphate acyltransferase